ncbi:CapA family protein [Thalassotalea montiporae]
MSKLFSPKLLSLATLALSLSPSFISYADTRFSAKVADENNQPIAGVDVSINGQNVRSNRQGEFTLNLPEQNYYQVTLSKGDYYQRVHTFSHKELKNLNTKAPFQLIEKKSGRVMFAFGGDVMMGRRYYKPYFDDPVLIKPDSILPDSKALVEHVKPYMALADIAAVNLETQLAADEPTQRLQKSVTFYSAPETVTALQWAGIDYVTLGNNHTFDYMDEGLTSTLNALNEAKLPYSGAGYNEAEALKPYNMTVNNQPLALLGYVGWHGDKKPTQTADAHQGGAAFGNMENIKQSVSGAKQQGNLPIVQYHGGLEYVKEPTGVTEQRLKSAVDNGAALVVAHHPHVTQGIELYNGNLIAYSMGNFIFDQNFSATQHSYILYVWLDDGEFSRAELVPIYVKDYKPTPAMDDERNRALTRIATLSAKRNTHVANHHGHGVISAANTVKQSEKSKLAQAYRLDVSKKTTLPIPYKAWSEQVQKVELPNAGLPNTDLPNNDLQYRLGSNLVNGSDFEQFIWFNAPERNFKLPKQWQLVTGGYQSKQAMQLTVDKNSTSLFGMKHFRRVYAADNPMTMTLQAKTDKPVKVNVYWQGRKSGQKLLDAYAESPKHFIKSFDLAQSNDWQALEVDFDSPRIRYRSYRVLVEFENMKNSDANVLLDNFALVEWHTAFQQNVKPFTLDEDGQMADYIGVNKTASKAITIKSH